MKNIVKILIENEDKYWTILVKSIQNIADYFTLKYSKENFQFSRGILRTTDQLYLQHTVGPTFFCPKCQ